MRVTVERPSERHLKAVSRDYVWCYGDGGHKVWKWGDLWLMVGVGWICDHHRAVGDVEAIANLTAYRNARDGF